MVEAMDIKRDFQKTEIGEYPTDWNIKELSVILKSTQLGGNYPNSVLNAEYVLIKMGNLGRGFIDLKKIFYIKSGTIPQQIDKSNYGDILFNTRNTLDLVGKVAIWKDELPLAFFNSNIMRLVFKDEEISSNFFMNYILNTPKSLHQLRGIATGTTSVAAIYTRDLIKLKVPVPTKAEQTAIATALNDADALITQLEKLIAKKRAIKQGAMHELLKPKKGWEVKKLGEVGEIVTGSTPPTQIKEYWNGTIPWITPTDIHNKKDIFHSEREITNKGLQVIRKIPQNSLLVTCIASIGKNAILRNDGACNQQINAIVQNGYYDIDFLYYLIEFSKNILIGSAGITATLILSKKEFSELEFYFPLLEEQTHIAQILSDMDAEIEALENKLNKYKMIKQGMMQNLLTGRIRLV